jgi:hypothetical protein
MEDETKKDWAFIQINVRCNATSSGQGKSRPRLGTPRAGAGEDRTPTPQSLVVAFLHLEGFLQSSQSANIECFTFMHTTMMTI